MDKWNELFKHIYELKLALDMQIKEGNGNKAMEAQAHILELIMDKMEELEEVEE